MNATLGKCTVRGEEKWYVSRIEGQRRKRSFFKAKVDAEAERDQLNDQTEEASKAWRELPAHQRNRLAQAYSKALELGIDVIQAIESAAAKQPIIESKTLATVITEILESKEKAGRASKYTSTLKTAYNQFKKGREAVRINKIGLAEIETFLDSKQLASRSTLRSRLSTLFKFCIRRGYRVDNPCERLERVTVAKSPPQIFTVEQFKKALLFMQTKRRRALPWFVLTTLCGLRPEEAQKTTKSDIHIDEGWIKIEAQTTKIRQRRVVYPKREALALLKSSLKKGKLPLTSINKKRVVRALRDHLGFKQWPKDITRHTAASYWLADCRSASHVADMLGHSEKTLRKNYKAIVTQKQAKQFWKAAYHNKKV